MSDNAKTPPVPSGHSLLEIETELGATLTAHAGTPAHCHLLEKLKLAAQADSDHSNVSTLIYEKSIQDALRGCKLKVEKKWS
jgi:hypothetical protein